MTAYLDDLRSQLRGVGTESREATLVAPLRNLVRGFAALDGRDRVDIRGQAQEPGIGRPDFSVKDGDVLVGHIETKEPGKGADPNLYRQRHDREQWNRFQRLPNLLYTDGIDFALWRDGALAMLDERPLRVRLDVDLTTDDRIGVDREVAGRLAAILSELVGWRPLPPRSLTALADRIAPLCATLRYAVEESLNDARSSVAHVTADVRASLFPDADDAQLADAFAQTCAYSMLLAQSEGAEDLHTATVERALRSGHPVLSRVVRVLLDPEAEDEISWAVELLRRQIELVDLQALAPHGEDTWLYFYEHFLAAYDPKLREDRGVYYTPKEVISCQVTLAEEILRERFGKPLGFADEAVTTLDPAVGTGSYPLAVIESAARSAARLGSGAVPAAISSLAERLNAFELLIGPYAVAHLRITESIRDHGGTPPAEGVRVYLTDALASPDVDPPVLAGILDPLVAEQRRAREMKSETPVVVCLGNPPYDREAHGEGDEGPRARKGGWVRFGDPGQTRPILRDFIEPLSAAGLGRHAKNLYNDYVYFWRFALWKTFEHDPAKTAETGGIVTFISAASYLGGPGFSYMRKHLRDLCDDIYIIDLGGYALGTRPTENVFAIRTPVAIAIAVRDPGSQQRAGRVWYADWTSGTTEEKLARLAAVRSLEEVDWRRAPDEPTARLIAVEAGEYSAWPKLGDLLPWQHSGVQLKRTWPIAPNRTTLEQRWERFVAVEREADLEAAFGGPRSRLSASPPPLFAHEARRPPLTDLLGGNRAPAAVPGEIVPYDAKSFDRQWVIRDERLGDRMRPVLWRILGPRQIFLCTLMTNPLGAGPGITVACASPPDLHYFRGSLGGADVLPLYRDAAGGNPNVTRGLLTKLSEALRYTVTPEDLVAYVVAVMGTSAYTERFREALSEPGPRIPVTRDPALWSRAVELGRRLIFLNTHGDRFDDVAGKAPVSKARITAAIPTTVEESPSDVSYDASEQALRIGGGEIRPVRAEVWNFSVSGYAVVQEWIQWRLAGPRPGQARSPLDQIRPMRWDFELQQELLRLLAIVDEIVTELTPTAATLLDAILAGDLMNASELPTPSDAERDEPRTQASGGRSGGGFGTQFLQSSLL